LDKGIIKDLTLNKEFTSEAFPAFMQEIIKVGGLIKWLKTKPACRQAGRKMNNYNIATIPGDGTGPEVVNEGLKVLEAVASKFDFKYQNTSYDLGGERISKNW